MDGILIINKDKGYTSHDVVARLRGILHQKKIGHTGTLDPDARGVLPVCLGRATRVCSMLTDTDKTYETVMMLGITTDTQDLSGQVLSRNTDIPGEEEILRAVLSFAGPYEQIPPMYSALKVGGKKLVDLARQGKVVERKPRPVMIHELEILGMDLPRVRMRIACSKGTYIRTLCADIGEKLGCGGAMESLVRTRAAGFSLADAVTLEEAERLQAEGRLEERLIPLEDVFGDLPRLVVKESQVRFLQNGNPLRVSREEAGGGETAVFFPDGRFAAVYAWDDGKNCLLPVKMFL